jgi:hypothetical protein
MTDIKDDIAIGHYYRGYILDAFIQLEMAINQYIVTYFLNDDKKSFELTFTILDRMSFRDKKDSFKSILDKLGMKNQFITTKKETNPINALLNEIQLLGEIRNQFAHYYLIAVLPFDDFSESGKVITLAKFKDRFEVKSYSEKELKDLIIRINKAEEKVNDLRKKIPLPEPFQ